MDLWIRSQHRKTLTKPCDLQMVHVNKGTEYAIISFTEMAGDIDLGIYKTKKRALEVLDEIQSFIENNYEADIPSFSGNMIANGRNVLKTRRIVYEMPKE